MVMLLFGMPICAILIYFVLASKGNEDKGVSKGNQGEKELIKSVRVGEWLHIVVLILLGNSVMSGIISQLFSLDSYAVLSLVGFIFFIPLALFYIFTSRSYVVITDKKVYGKTFFGTRVDLPLDSISAVATSGLFGKISFSTSSGSISFLFVKNRQEMHSVMNDLLVERNSKKVTETIVNVPVQNVSEADEIKKYKDLLDSGIITQEEFDAKKKQLLGL